MVDTTTELPGSGGGGNAGSSFSDNYFNVYNETDPSKLLAFSAALIAAGVRATLRSPATLGSANYTLVLSETTNAFTDQQSILDSGGPCLILKSTQVSGGGVFLSIEDTVSGFAIGMEGPGSGISANRGQAVLDSSGAYPLVGNTGDPPVAGRTGKVNRTAQTADIASTKLTDTCPAGMYRVSYVIEDTTADVTAGIVTLTISWTDDVGATTATATQTLATTGRQAGVVTLYLASGNITYATTHSGTIGSAQYALRMRCEYLG
jgi:hypothetical protein